jgi:2-oxoglutarate ferredoxin oxidoreductase subunit alpha
MVTERGEKVERLADFIPPQDVYGPEEGALLVLSWGGTYGAVRSAVRRSQAKGLSVAHAHLRFLNPLPRNLREILSRYDKVVVPELNSGQLAFVLRGRFALPIEAWPKLHARPYTAGELETRISSVLNASD